MSKPLGRILFLVHRFPYPPDKGDRIRTFNIIKFLSERSRLAVATLADEPVPTDHQAILAGYCEQLHVADLQSPLRWLRAGGSVLRGCTVTEGAFHSPELRTVISQWAASEPFDAVLVSSSGMVPYLRLSALRHTPAVVDLIDVDSEKWRDFARNTRSPKRFVYQLEARRLRRLEADMPPSVRAVTVVSQPEAELYRQITDRTPVHVIGNGVDLDYFRPMDLPREKTCVFVGAMDYHPNVDAVTWFADEVWPDVFARHPDARFQIVGRNPTAAVRQLANRPGIEVTGLVPDIRPYLARCTAAIAPLRIARGIQNKVLEAMAMGCAVVASPQAVEGLIVPNDAVRAAASVSEWRAVLSQLLNDDGLHHQLARTARRFVETDHDWGIKLKPFGRLLARRTPARDRTAELLLVR